jgi:hypothetical protein
MSLENWSSPIGTKFNEDGTLKRFAGNTVICPFAADHPAFALLCFLQNEFATKIYASKFALLPPSSFHMTVFDGVLDQVRNPERWPNELDIGRPLDKVHRFFSDHLKDVSAPASVTMAIEDIFSHPTIALCGATATDNDKLRQFRDLLANTLGLRTPDHAEYRFHITLGYTLYQLDDSEKKQVAADIKTLLNLPEVRNFQIELPDPEFCHFEDMGRFNRQFVIGRNAVTDRQKI